MMLPRFAVMCVALATLAGCTAGRPKERINPPVVSIQELAVRDGQCQLRLRVQNHSSVSMRFSEIVLETFTLDGRELAPLTLAPALEVPPYTGEPFRHTLPCPELAGDASELIYRLQGIVRADQPRRDRFNVRHGSRLLPVPGLDGVYR
jgi:hypothetical protein